MRPAERLIEAAISEADAWDTLNKYLDGLDLFAGDMIAMAINDGTVSLPSTPEKLKASVESLLDEHDPEDVAHDIKLIDFAKLHKLYSSARKSNFGHKKEW